MIWISLIDAAAFGLCFGGGLIAMGDKRYGSACWQFSIAVLNVAYAVSIVIERAS